MYEHFCIVPWKENKVGGTESTARKHQRVYRSKQGLQRIHSRPSSVTREPCIKELTQSKLGDSSEFAHNLVAFNPGVLRQRVYSVLRG